MTQLGKYTLHELLGKGGFGAVYRATDDIGRVVAIKILKPGWSDEPEVVERFRREALAAGSLFHTRIATILDFGEEGGRLFLVIRYVPGISLEKLLQQEGRLPFDRALHILRDVADALDYAHANGFLHRDVKPANIIISEQGGAVLTDFGLVRAAQSSGMSTSNVLLGTPNYMAPDLWQGKAASAQTDIYSLACVAAEMLTGQVLFAADSPAVVMTKHLIEGPRLPSAWPDDIPGGITDVLLRAFGKVPGQPFSTASEFVRSLDGLQKRNQETSVPAVTVNDTRKNGTEPILVKKSEPTMADQMPSKADALIETYAPEDHEKSQSTKDANQKVFARSFKKKPWLTFLGCVLAVPVFGFLVYFAILVVDSFDPGGTIPTQPTMTVPVEKTQVARATATRPPVIQPTATTQPEPTVAANRHPIKACLVTDTGGIDDKSFNQVTWEGMLRAQKELYTNISYLESQANTDYEKHIAAFIQQPCDLIFASGFLLADDTKAVAEANPYRQFVITDFAYDPPIPNITAVTFRIEEAGFLNGYLAAGMTRTGKVGTYGGIQIPPVTQYMDGFVKGVAYFNQENGTEVEVFGWDVDSQTGLFLGNFDSIADGRTMGDVLINEAGVDIIMPVAGPAGLGTVESVQATPNQDWVIGVDHDWRKSLPSEYQEYILSSALKNLDVVTYDLILAASEDRILGVSYEGTLANNGVGIGTLHENVPLSMKASLNRLKAMIIEGKIEVR